MVALIQAQLEFVPDQLVVLVWLARRAGALLVHILHVVRTVARFGTLGGIVLVRPVVPHSAVVLLQLDARQFEAGLGTRLDTRLVHDELLVSVHHTARTVADHRPRRLVVLHSAVDRRSHSQLARTGCELDSRAHHTLGILEPPDSALFYRHYHLDLDTRKSLVQAPLHTEFDRPRGIRLAPHGTRFDRQLKLILFT